MRTAVLTVAYPGHDMKTFARECFDSLGAQSERGFDVLVCNDGADYLSDMRLPPDIAVKVEPVTGSPAAIRRHAIRSLLQDGYEIIVFTDIDDCLAPNRIEVVTALIAGGNHVVFNELEMFGANMQHSLSMLAGRINDGSVFTADKIMHANCLGLSNTAIHRDAMTDDALLPDEVVAFDWLFFTRLLLAGRSARFTSATTTHYRRHDANLAAVTDWPDGAIRNGVRVKRQHYSALRQHAGYATMAAEFTAIGERMDNDESFAAAYCEAVRAAIPPQPWWWEPIKARKELGL
jgi:hypothetical protein